MTSKEDMQIFVENIEDDILFLIFISFFIKCIGHEILLGRAFRAMKNGFYFIVIAVLVAELFKIMDYAN